MKRLLFACAIALVGSLAAIAACKQSEGDRCQVNEDCESGLVCNKAKGTCTGSGGGDFDAAIIDAVDSALDAMTDAPFDAPPD